MDDGRWTMDDGRWTMDDGRWLLDDGASTNAVRIGGGEHTAYFNYNVVRDSHFAGWSFGC
jgi:hypothetical protein